MAAVVRIPGQEPACDSATVGRRIQAAWRPKLRLNYVTLAVIALLALICIVYGFSLSMTIPRLVGLSIFFPSFLLFVLARIQLGRAFSIEAKAEILVTNGLYSRIRNPIYVFGALMIVGGIVFANMPILLLVFVILIPLQIIRSRKEEQVLTEKFGDVYRDYKRRTWF
jgi:protein-S-isoprenylcysteine O-methyltransferase Ste14